ncbi:unnamed protein product [Gordionus sp. m RMFG-2023]
MSTGLTGLAVNKSPHLTLGNFYSKILYALTLIPENAAYRICTEKLIMEKLNHVKTEPLISKLENKLGDQVEELIQQAENELNLVKKMIIWKPWESLQKEAPQNQWKWPIN